MCPSSVSAKSTLWELILFLDSQGWAHQVLAKGARKRNLVLDLTLNAKKEPLNKIWWSRSNSCSVFRSYLLTLATCSNAMTKIGITSLTHLQTDQYYKNVLQGIRPGAADTQIVQVNGQDIAVHFETEDGFGEGRVAKVRRRQRGRAPKLGRLAKALPRRRHVEGLAAAPPPALANPQLPPPAMPAVEPPPLPPPVAPPIEPPPSPPPPPASPAEDLEIPRRPARRHRRQRHADTMKWFGCSLIVTDRHNPERTSIEATCPFHHDHLRKGKVVLCRRTRTIRPPDALKQIQARDMLKRWLIAGVVFETKKKHTQSPQDWDAREGEDLDDTMSQISSAAGLLAGDTGSEIVSSSANTSSSSDTSDSSD